MDGSRFKVKLIGGKLVQVPDFDYVKEYNQSSNHLSRESYGKIQPAQGRQNHQRYQNSYVARTDYQKYDLQNNAKQNTHLLSRERMQCHSKGSRVSNYQSLDFDQRYSNQLQAERNKRRVQEQLQSSSLVLDPVENDREEHTPEDVKDNEALSRQVADCLQSTNKQKLAYALRAMNRLDTNGSGYITVKEFRDVLLMYQIFIIGGTLEKLIEKYRNNNGKMNYTQCWNFVTDSFNSRNAPRNNATPRNEESDEDKALKTSIKNIQRYLRSYAQKHDQPFDISELLSSFENCDRGRTHLMAMKEMRIICSFYLKINEEDLDLVLEHCDPQKNGWVNYYTFLNTLKDAQPTYLPPIKQARRNTFNLDDEDSVNIREHINAKNENHNEGRDDNEALYGEQAKRYERNDSRRMNKYEGRKRLEGNGTIGGTNGEASRFSRGDEGGETPRRKWYESDESWKKRKRRNGKIDVKKNPVSRKKWEHSAPVRSFRDSYVDDLSEDMDTSDDSFIEKHVKDTIQKPKKR